MRQKFLNHSVKSLAVLLIVLLTLSACSISVKGTVPLAKIGVLSDVHIGLYGMTPSPSEKFASALDQINEYFGKTDALVFPGDFTNTGVDSEYDEFFRILKEHAQPETLISIQMGNHEYYRDTSFPDKSADHNFACQDAYKKYVGYLESDFTVNGVHLIGLSARSEALDYKSPSWYLEKRVKMAAKDNPDAPIFVFSHSGFGATFEPLEGTYDRPAYKIASGTLPQVISISGHTHYPINDPRMICQENITSVEASTAGAYFGNYRGSDPANTKGGKIASQGLLITVYDDYSVDIVRYDFVTKSQIGQIWKINTADIIKNKKEAFTYGLEERAAVAAAPVFPDGSAITVNNLSSNKINVSHPAAHIFDEVSDDAVYYYKYYIKDVNTGENVFSVKIISDYFKGSAKAEAHTLTVPDLEALSDYQLTVLAESCWGKVSEPLILNFSTPANSTPESSLPAKYLAVDYSEGSFADTCSGAECTVDGTPVLSDGYAKLYGDATYSYALSDEFYKETTDGLALEGVVYIDSDQGYSAREYSLISNTEYGGFGLSLYGGALMATVNIEGSYFDVIVPVTLDSWNHIVLSYDGAFLKLYVNGKLAGSSFCNGSISHVSRDAARLVVGGDSSCNYASPSYLSNVRVKAFNLYTDYLTSKNVEKLYSETVFPK